MSRPTSKNPLVIALGAALAAGIGAAPTGGGSSGKKKKKKSKRDIIPYARTLEPVPANLPILYNADFESMRLALSMQTGLGHDALYDYSVPRNERFNVLGALLWAAGMREGELDRFIRGKTLRTSPGLLLSAAYGIKTDRDILYLHRLGRSMPKESAFLRLRKIMRHLQATEIMVEKLRAETPVEELLTA